MIIEMNAQYEHNGVNTYNIDRVMNPSEIIPPLHSDTKERSKSDCYKSSPLTLSASAFSGSTESGSASRLEELRNHPTLLMQERWIRSNQNLPSVDRRDCVEERPLFNDGRRTEAEHQNYAEYTQSSYQRLRSQEEVFVMHNYLDQNAS